MADQLFDETVELRLSAKLFHRSAGVAFDFGTVSSLLCIDLSACCRRLIDRKLITF